MNILGKTVLHKTLGEGIITEHTGNSFYVRFSSRTSKFLFPASFESFLRFSDDSLQQEVLLLLKKEKAEKEQKSAIEKQKWREQRKKEEEAGIRAGMNSSINHIERKWERKENRNKGLRTSTTISIDDRYLFDRSVDILNECFGKNHKGWQRGGYDLSCEGKKIMAWFPKMAVYEYGIEKSQSSTANVINTMSADGKTIREYFPDKKWIGIDNIIRITFAKFPGEPYRYVGTFIPDAQATTPQERIYKRIATEVDLSPWKL